MEVWLNGKEASPNLDALANTEVKRNTDMMQNINQENIKERKDTVDVIKNIVNQNYHLFYLNIIQKRKKHTNLKKFKKFCKKKHIRKHKVAPEYYPKRKHHKKKLSLKKQIKNCLKKFKPKKISPEYYPSKKLNRKQKHAEWLREQGINPATPNAKPSQPAA